MLVLKRIQQCEAILKQYPGELPFTPVLKNFFRQHPNMGGRDRKEASALCYAMLRTGNLRSHFHTFEKRAAWAIFLCLPEQQRWLDELAQLELLPAESAALSGESRMEFFLSANPGISASAIFPAPEEVSKGIDQELFYLSHLQQPLLWFRVKEKRKDLFLQKLDESNIYYTQHQNAVGLPNGFDLQKLLGQNTNTWGEVQDWSSQQVTSLLELTGHEKVWDVCAASGGKSLALLDRYPKLNLYVSDIRASILENLLTRFKAAGMLLPYVAKADLSVPSKQVLFEAKTDRVKVEKEYFNLLILDVPCSGSGTWSRNPEFLSYDKKKIKEYQQLQRNILSNSRHFLQKGGYLLYITCSVYHAENEANLEYAETLGMEVVTQHYFEGYKSQADTMFAALLKKG